MPWTFEWLALVALMEAHLAIVLMGVEAEERGDSVARAAVLPAVFAAGLGVWAAAVLT